MSAQINICKLWGRESFACYVPPDISGYILNPMYMRLFTNENITDVIFSHIGPEDNFCSTKVSKDSALAKLLDLM